MEAAEAAGKRKPKKPPFVLQDFLTFIRSPYLVGFEVAGFGDAPPYRFITINAHLLYGDASKQKQEREREFHALLDWIVNRAKERDRSYHSDILLLGDLNLDFEDDEARRAEITEMITRLNADRLVSAKSADAYFPFLHPHPAFGPGVFRTNARRNQTYDQVGIFAHDERLPRMIDATRAGKVDGDFDFRMFDFVQLFAEAVHGKGKAFDDLTKTQKKALYKKFEHDVSDHMPVWIRLPKPHVGMGDP